MYNFLVLNFHPLSFQPKFRFINVIKFYCACGFTLNLNVHECVNEKVMKLSVNKKVMKLFIHLHECYGGRFQTSKQKKKVMSGNQHPLVW